MKKMLKRADGSTSQGGLWDNIRAKAASNKKTGKKGKAPSKAMLEQERAINAKKYLVGGPEKPASMTPQQKQAAKDAYALELGMVKDATGKFVNPPKKVTSVPSSMDRMATGFSNIFAEPKPTRPEGAGIRRKTGGKSMSSFLEDSKELKFGGPSKRKYLVGGPETTPTMTPQQALKEMGAGRMTGAQANAATGYGNKPKKYTNAENIDNLKKVFSGSSTVDAQGNVVPKPKKPMADISTAGLRPTAPAESTNAYTRRLKSGGKKKMGGKNC